jgi:hypothetical protein
MMVYSTDEIFAAAQSYKKRRTLADDSHMKADLHYASECSSDAHDDDNMSEG